MNTIIRRAMTSVTLVTLCTLASLPVQAEPQAPKKLTALEKAERESKRFPIGCRPVGYKQSLKVLTLYPGKESALQSMYFFLNQLPETVSLYQMRDKDSIYSMRFNHSIKGNSWAVLATGEPLLKYTCTLGDGKTGYGKIVDCAETIKVCQYVNVKFGLNNKGNFWIVDSNTRNGAVSEVVHYGIIPGV